MDSANRDRPLLCYHVSRDPSAPQPSRRMRSSPCPPSRSRGAQMFAWLLVGSQALHSSPPAGIHAPRRPQVTMHVPQEPPNEFRSRSTARVEEESFAEGTDDRRARLHTALEAVGVDITELTESADLAGSSALRLYSSFVNPKSAGALANTQKPQRAAAIARAVDFQLRERRAFRDEWLRNHDRALAELPADVRPHPLVIVLDNVRSAASLPSPVEPEPPLCRCYRRAQYSHSAAPRRCRQHPARRRGGEGAARALLRLYPVPLCVQPAAPVAGCNRSCPGALLWHHAHAARCQGAQDSARCRGVRPASC